MIFVSLHEVDLKRFWQFVCRGMHRDASQHGAPKLLRVSLQEQNQLRNTELPSYRQTYNGPERVILLNNYSTDAIKGVKPLGASHLLPSEHGHEIMKGDNGNGN
jgi:hypothetical protein